MEPSADYDIVLLTDARYESPRDPDWYVAQLLKEEQLVLDALSARGLRAARVAWSNPDFDWRRTRAAVFRSTWDYFNRFTDFSAWMERTTAQTRLLNSPDLVRWNVDKHYLRDLGARGVAVPPTVFIEPGSTETLSELLTTSGWSEAVLKPAVSGAARHTYRINQATAAAQESILRALLRSETMLLQPFQECVLTRGEISLMVIGGVCTHAVRKIARPGDFRVQDDHGGTVHPHCCTEEEKAFAERAVAACPEAPLYARVDAVQDNSGALTLMEMELVEPELFFRFHPAAAEALADELVRKLKYSAG